MRHAIIPTLATLLCVLPATLSAQEPPPVQPGARVRVTTRECSMIYTEGSAKLSRVCPEHQGTFSGMTADSIVLAVGEPATQLALPLASVTRLATPRGRKSKMVTGAIIGGLVVGGGSFAIAAHVCDPGALPLYDPICSWGVVGSLTLAGTGSGILLGGLIGAFIKTERWEEVPLEQLRVQPVATFDGRFGLAASVRF